MKAPIYEFAKQYAKSGSLRLHMPGHKGHSYLGCESVDITEFDGADCLYSADGIIAESERNASELFGCKTFYSTEGSSHCVRAMLYLSLLYAKENSRPPLIAAARNVHKSFVSAVALLGLDVLWINKTDEGSYLSCDVDAEELDTIFSNAETMPAALYLTSPDYLGHMTDVFSISKVCHKHGILLLVDCAHGAYLKFLEKSAYPTDLGADVCCSSAHKTLPALTGGAYLHISNSAPSLFTEQAKNALSLFGSTSPSYLILESLDLLNTYLADGYAQRLFEFSERTSALKEMLTAHGYVIYGEEPLKLTLSVKPYGYDGREFAKILADHSMICEFFDSDLVVMMLTPELSIDELARICEVLINIPKRTEIKTCPPRMSLLKAAMSVRDATLASKETLPIELCAGRILADASVGCPPAVPIAVCGELLSDESIARFKYYGITTCTVVK